MWRASVDPRRPGGAARQAWSGGPEAGVGDGDVCPDAGGVTSMYGSSGRPTGEAE
jgi:hypothetical protein